eukprot:TRINITY_DN16803_c0_g1_i2.p1 TRINITY_DN16803_c0_g1~~TRINITY_DN16803_c0_g1_i2.p1  ORF type:complete len:150 (-),score=11.31 TRINITY_DN16803_c0_g1_i2:769-1218(-)
MEVYDPSLNTWTLHDLPSYIGYILSALVLRQRFIFVMYSDHTQLLWATYDTSTNEWASLDKCPVPLPHNHRAIHLVRFECAPANGKIYVVQVRGGKNALTENGPQGSDPGRALVLEFNPNKAHLGAEAWREVRSLPRRLNGAACAGLRC